MGQNILPVMLSSIIRFLRIYDRVLNSVTIVLLSPYIVLSCLLLVTEIDRKSWISFLSSYATTAIVLSTETLWLYTGRAYTCTYTTYQIMC